MIGGCVPQRCPPSRSRIAVTIDRTYGIARFNGGNRAVIRPASTAIKCGHAARGQRRAFPIKFTPATTGIRTADVSIGQCVRQEA